MQFLKSNTGNKFHFIKSPGINKVYFKNGKQYSAVGTLFWDFTSNPSGKTLTAFNVSFLSGSVTADWGDGSYQILISGVNYNKTFS